MDHLKQKMKPTVKVLLLVSCLTVFLVFMSGYLKDTPLSLDVGSGSPCQQCLSDDQWFAARFNKSVEPFLSAEHTLPKDAFNWWKYLQNEKRSYDVYSETVRNLFQVFPATPNVQKPSPNHCRTCAVVGNSGNLKGSCYGPLINSHNIILRMNTGRTTGYEADVGHRTTHRIMYPESGMDLDDDTHLVLFPFKIQDLEWVTKALTTGFFGTSYMPVRHKIKANKDLVMVINPAFMKYVHETWLEKRGGYPSTGFMSLIMALHICDEVHVFGFGADKDGNWNHYWEELRNKKLKTGLHPGTHEYETILRLARHLKIKFYMGS
ncbi:CMP-N-acetylneuraminate-beta-galactosamide-alpha-2%2C3-sialyltransferase 1-like [Xyrichtys novacula]|uniref:CMP-N-acetylneuraminate-beta-galactosamide-alpha-2,3-sialyltransferase 1 n=1 Tax=Xyrichtys novacula TaxID=13765 RepID=A0AAV1HC60_XYRNO|nr:CMP-N-acetylneuraminate-beta-galactosamide-alpha-2%2C3-sialyltransferase 1-like [Xyrichtys novacula]